MVLLAGAIFTMPRGQSTWLVPRFFIPAGLVAVELVFMMVTTPPWRNRARDETKFISQVLAVTDRADTIMDEKGETIFRIRPFYYGLETVARNAIKRGEIADDIPQHLIASRTCVAVSDKNSGYSPQSRAFIEKNYLQVTRLRVVGIVFHSTTAATISFDIVIPARYAVVTRQGVARGQLDGEPYHGPLFLAAGHHEYRRADGESASGILWAQAVERNFLPTEFQNP